MRIFAVTSTVLAITAGLIFLGRQSDSTGGLLFFVPFTLGPLFVTLLLDFFVHRRLALGLLLASTLIYFAWFLFVYLSAFYWHPDAQGAIALLFIGIYSLPVMIPLWITAWLKRKPLA